MAKNKNLNIAFNRSDVFFKKLLTASLFCNIGSVKLNSEGANWKPNFHFKSYMELL